MNSIHDGKISPSLMCVDFMAVKPTLEAFEKENIEYLHIDIMDGTFVPNFTLGTDYCKAIRKNSYIPLDLHMMVERPEEKINFFDIRKNDIVSVHVETTAHLQKTLSKISEKGAKAYAALNPATPICFIENVLDDIDGVLVMTVNPGFAGQKLIPKTLEKITAVRQMLDNSGRTDAKIEVDGNVSFENAKLMRQAGADTFVAGTSSIFNGSLNFHDAVARLREIIQ